MVPQSGKLRNWGSEEGKGRERRSPPAVCGSRQVTIGVYNPRCHKSGQASLCASSRPSCPGPPLPPWGARRSSLPGLIPLGSHQMETQLGSPCPVLWFSTAGGVQGRLWVLPGGRKWAGGWGGPRVLHSTFPQSRLEGSGVSKAPVGLTPASRPQVPSGRLWD